MSSDLFSELVNFIHPESDRKGEQHFKCPLCGHESSPRKPHCSFSANPPGWYCFCCGGHGSLIDLADKVGYKINGSYIAPVVIVPPEHERPDPDWMDRLGDYVAGYTTRADRFELWQKYKPIKPESIRLWQLGVGRFPPYSSQCQHTRLIVPIFMGGKVAQLRGRSMGCDCNKWLGTAMNGRPPILFNGARLFPPELRHKAKGFSLGDTQGEAWIRGKLLLIVENPVEAIRLEAAGFYAVATLGVTMWNQGRSWTQVLAHAKPESVLVLYDHDLAGNGTISQAELKQWIREWKEKNGQNREPPIPNGIRLANELKAAGINAHVYPWSDNVPKKADIGDSGIFESLTKQL
jgi:hypothetical protein